ncbi:hypothetical protein JVT61DRAFT_6986 [Boletus reticuloceps]|uniref:Uncharacterized protein n=1 Tax=Boletus reticuloceps TaxID=495285 RepID=A0A8I3A6B4_9AGAM|nr:hypothetical protein JVT61DRAFT_6986 [Boletus reticuloceps]
MSRPDPSQATWRPTCMNAGKGGYLSQLRKTSEAIEQPQHERVKDPFDNEPINHLAPALHHPRKKRTKKQRAKLTSRELHRKQPQATTFVGRQPLEEYERDCSHHRTKDNTVTCTGKGGIRPNQNSRNNSRDKETQMDIDNHHEHHTEDRDHNRRMDVNAHGSLLNVDDQQIKVPRSNGSHMRGADAIREWNCEDQMDTTDDLAPQGNARVQPSHHRPQHAPSQQSQPSQNTAGDTLQPRCHISNAQHLQGCVLPSRPLSRSNSNEVNENTHHNSSAQVNAV